MLEAVTGRAEAAFVTPAGGRGSAVVEPLTSYFAGRVKRDMNNGRTTVGALATAVNRRLSSYETIKRFIAVDTDLSVETGELTDTLKVKRKVVHEKYRHLFESLY